MSELRVSPHHVADSAARLGGISGGVAAHHAHARRHADAALGTPAEHAVGGLMARWSHALPEFALAGDRLAAAVAVAAMGYAVTDAAVGAAWDPAGAKAKAKR
jgi:hypothetical protein